MDELRPIAIYLPQFHPIPENDEWWGKGFTEWTNVAKAKPLFEGHYQPHLPADLGYYDLRLSETREAQAALAKKYGIHGFCYYHYWFNGRRILERPFNEVFESGNPDFPFMLCWANENWTRTWDGQNQNILLEQKYNDNDDRAHIKSLIPYFKDSRYIRIDNKPVFAIYRSGLLPDLKRTLDAWREECLKEGIELYICRFENFGNYGKSFVKDGFNASIEFQPFTKELNEFTAFKMQDAYWNNWRYKILRKYYQLTRQNGKVNHAFEKCHKLIGHRLDYNEYVDYILHNYKFENEYVKFPGIAPSWDNTARRGDKAFILKNATPQKFKEWLMFIKAKFRPPSKEENLIFINAWNEWAEGNHLEPCQKWGLQYLESVKEVVGKDD